MKFLLFVLTFFLSVSLIAQEILSDANTNFDDENYEVALKQYLKVYKKFVNFVGIS